MAEGPTGPYSARQLRWALVMAAILGWAGVTMMALDVTNWDRFLGLLPIAAFVGLPISFLLTAIVGEPVIRRFTRQSVSWTRAATGGALVAAIIAVVSVVIGRLAGLRQSMDPGRHSQIGSGDFLVELDGLLTPYGWYLLGVRTALFIAFGAAVGFFVRLVIGPGKSPDKA